MRHTADSFTAAFAHIARQRLPDAEVSVEAPFKVRIRRSSGAIHHVDLENAWQAACAPDADADDVLERFSQAVHPDAVKVPEGAEFIDALRPIIKPHAYLTQVEAQLGADQVPALPLVGELSILFVADTGGAMALVSQAQLDAVGLDPQQALEVALSNLSDSLETIEVHGDSARMVVAGGNYEASLLLLSTIWTQMAENVEGDLVAVPLARDLLVFADSADEAGMLMLARMCDDGEAGKFNYAISTTCLRWTGHGWALWAVDDDADDLN